MDHLVHILARNWQTTDNVATIGSKIKVTALSVILLMGGSKTTANSLVGIAHFQVLGISLPHGI